MKKCFVMMAVLLLLCSSCVGESDFVLDLNEETTTFFFEKRAEVFVIINKNSKIFHLDADCIYLSRMMDENRMELTVETLEKLLLHGYQPCSRCAEENIILKDILP